jgi:hypothetical protein
MKGKTIKESTVKEPRLFLFYRQYTRARTNAHYDDGSIFCHIS